MTLGFEDRSAAEERADRARSSGNGSGKAEAAGPRRVRIRAGVRRLIDAIVRSDDEAVERAVLQLSERSRWLAPLALIVGAFLMLFQGLKLLVTNWRLTLIQIVPAMWIWIAMLDIKIHVLHGKGFTTLYGAVLAVAALGVTAATAASFYLNGVFAFAIVDRGEPQIRPAFAKANAHLRVILAWGCGVGVVLAFSALVVQRWGLWWFAVSQSIVVGIMMLCYLAVPARLVGIDTKKGRSRRDKLAATAVGGAVGAVICSPPYALGRFGILMLGWHGLFWLGVILIVIGVLLQTGVTSAVKAVKFSAKLIGNPAATAEPGAADAADAGAAGAMGAARE
jgi:hypothetical protein